MEVFMRNMPFSTNRDQVIVEIANVLHGPNFPGSRSTPNFDVHLHAPRYNHTAGRHAPFRTGTVTFPTKEIGDAFLSRCGGEFPRTYIHLGGLLVKFCLSNREPRREVVERIQRTKYVDPYQRHHDRQRERTDLSEVQFVWECRDEALSIEWSTARYKGKPSLEFNEENREIHVYPLSKSEWITIPFTDIKKMSTCRTSQVFSCCLRLWNAPRFEYSGPRFDFTGFGFAGFDFTGFQKQDIYRSTDLKNPDFHRVKGFVSTTMRFVYESIDSFTTFRKKWEKILPHKKMDVYDCEVVSRELFSVSILDELSDWLRQLDLATAFQLHALVLNGSLDPKELLSLRSVLCDRVLPMDKRDAVRFLAHFRNELDNTWFSDEPQMLETVPNCFSRSISSFRAGVAPALSGDLFNCLHVFVTPTRYYLDGPYPERTNRIIRDYAEFSDHFLRVSFRDENDQQYKTAKPVFIDSCVGEVLRKGISIGGRKFEFLAYSQSALKQHAVWFINSFWSPRHNRQITAESIIESIGTFQNLRYDAKLAYCPARYAARISQAFTSTETSVSIQPEEIIFGADILSSDGKWCFTDGVGSVSSLLADEIWQTLKEKRQKRFKEKCPRPSAYQIRFRGSKGVVSVDYKLQGRALCLRPSMIKFESPELNDIEIAKVFDKPRKMYLNRPLIAILEGLGIPAEVFLYYQTNAVEDILRSNESVLLAAKTLDMYGLGNSYRLPSILINISKLHYELSDPFYKEIVKNTIFHALRDIKYRSRIPVPGWTVVGVADTHSYLKEGEVFVCLEGEEGERTYLQGPVCVSRSPTIHPGDVQMARAIGRPPPDSPFAFECLRNTIVFSTQGSRSLPSCLGGGDLDGDEYCVTHYTSLHPQKSYPPSQYEPAKRAFKDKPCTINDVIDFVVQFIVSDNVGIIASRWLLLADKYGIENEDCIKLAGMHSDAVDFPKTGVAVPADALKKLSGRNSDLPDWNEPETGKRPGVTYYRSEKALGKLFRAIDLPSTSLEEDLQNLAICSENHHDLDSEHGQLNQVIRSTVSGYITLTDMDASMESSLEDMYSYHTEQLEQICRSYTMNQFYGVKLTETEVVTGTILGFSSQRTLRKEKISKLREHASHLVSHIHHDLTGGREENHSPKRRMRLAYGAWELSLRKKGEFGARSFALIALGAIFDAMKLDYSTD